MVKRLSTVDQNDQVLDNVPEPTEDDHAATKGYVDDTLDTKTSRQRLELIGERIDQTFAKNEEARWLDLIRQAGSGAPGGFTYLGGDVTDMFVTNGGDRAWIGADWFAGTSVNADDTYGGGALPYRNGVILEDDASPGFDQQLYHSGGSGVWIDAPSSGYTGTIWWPIAGFNDGGTDRILCWQVSPGGPYGILVDSHIVTLSVFGTVASVVETNTGSSDKFWIDGVLRDTSYTYIYGEEFVPDYDADTANDGSVPNYGKGDLYNDNYTLKRVARVANGSFTTVASWEYWDGSTWSSDIDDATPMVDTNGEEIHGDAGVAKIATNHYVLAAHQLVESHVTVYKSTTPYGPWEKIARVPAPTQGMEIGGGVQIGQLIKVMTSLDDPDGNPIPEGHSICFMSRNLLGSTDAFSDRNIRRYAPQFVIIPNDVDSDADPEQYMLTANNLSDIEDAAAARVNLDLEIGVDVQAYDSDLTTWAGKTAPSGTVVGTTDTQTLSGKTLTTPTIASFANAAHSHQNSTGGGTISIVNATSGTLTVARGGTGRTTATTAYGIIAAGTSATGSQQTISPGSSGQILKSNGASALATFQTGAPSDVGLGNVDNTSDATKNSASATLTNKRFQNRVSSAASASTLTPSLSTANEFEYTALAANLTINAPTGTPVDGEKLLFVFKDNGTSRTLTWNATFVPVGVTLPTATVINKVTMVGARYSSSRTRWEVIAVSTEA